MTDPALASRLERLRALDLMDHAPEPQFDAIVAAAAESTGASSSMISLIGADRQWFKATVGIDHRETPLADSICAHAIRGDGVFVVDDLSADPRFADMTPVKPADGIRFYAGAPLRLRDGAVLGTLCVIDVATRDGLEEHERLALEALARRTVAAFELRRDLAAGTAAGTPAALVTDAADLLARASAALDLAGATAPLALLEQVIAMVETLAQPAPEVPPVAEAA